MAGLQGLTSRLGKCKNKVAALKKKPKRGVVYKDADGNLLWEEGVEYNDGILVAPLRMTVKEWEEQNIIDEQKQVY